MRERAAKTKHVPFSWGSRSYLGDGAMMKVAVKTGAAFDHQPAEVLFQGSSPSLLSAGYDVSPDGERFLMVKAGAGGPAPRELILVQNWFEELKPFLAHCDRYS